LRFLALFGFLVGEGAMVVYSRRRIKMGGMGGARMRSAAPSPLKAEDQKERAVQSFGRFRVDAANNPPNAAAADRD
jgi:hypothetical protein